MKSSTTGTCLNKLIYLKLIKYCHFDCRFRSGTLKIRWREISAGKNWIEAAINYREWIKVF